MRMLGSTRVKCDAEALPERLEVSWRVSWSSRCFGIDRDAFELVPLISREKVNVKVGCCIAMDLVVHLNRSDYTCDCCRNSPDIGDESVRLNIGQVVQLDGMATED